MFVILLFIFLLILIIVNIILISTINVNKQKKLVYGDGINKKIVFGGKPSSKAKSSSHAKHKLQTKHKSQTSHNHPSGWQLYTLENCDHCDKQLDTLQGFKTYIKYKEDGNNILVNNIAGPLYSKHIEGFPFWYNSTTGEERYGKQDINSLL